VTTSRAAWCFVWGRRGRVVTNYHLIREAHRASVTLANKSTWDARLVSAASGKDLAVLRIDAGLIDSVLKAGRLCRARLITRGFERQEVMGESTG
jgi:S1-C subfamily serine protease